MLIGPACGVKVGVGFAVQPVSASIAEAVAANANTLVALILAIRQG